MVDSIFGGLASPFFVHDSRSILRYLLFLVLMDGISGYGSFLAIRERKLYTLMRYGWKDWYAAILRRNIRNTTGAACLLFLVSAFPFTQISTGIAFLVFVLNINFLAILQTLLILSSNQAMTGYVVVLLIQLVSVFFSQFAGTFGMIVFPGNWGCLNRSDFIMTGGFPLLPVVVLELLLSFTGCIWGWKFVKCWNRKME